MTTHTHTCPRCAARTPCTRDDARVPYALCAACDERRHDDGVHAADALDVSVRAGALVRCTACKRLHAGNTITH